MAKKIRNKRKALGTKRMTPAWHKLLEEDIRRIQASAGRFVYFHEPRPYSGIRKILVPAVAMPDGTYQPAW